MILDAFVEFIDDDKDLLFTTVVCYDSKRSKQVAVGRAVFNRYTPKLGVLDNVRPFFRMLWDNKPLNFLGKSFLEHYQSLHMIVHKRNFERKQKLFPKFSIEAEREKYRCSGNSNTCSEAKVYNGLTEEEFIAVTEEEPVFGHRVLGMRVLSIAPGLLTTVMPFRASFMGNFVTGAQHGGVSAALVDQTAGMCARSAVTDDQQRVSTVDFSIDYLAPAPCFEHIVCEARVVSGHDAQQHIGGNSRLSDADPSGGGGDGGRGTPRGELIFVETTCWNENRSTIISVSKLTFNVYTRRR